MNGTDELLKSLDTLRKLSEGTIAPSLLTELDEFSLKLSSEKFYLVVVGLFKRGKSTLINALLGEQIAPVAVTPLTAIVTLFEYGEERQAEIHFIDGRKESVVLGEVNGYITEEDNPENKKQVARVKIFAPNELLRQVVLVDTPGIGSVLEHNTQTTYGFVPKIDAALFVLSADTPITKADMEFLSELKKSSPHVFYALNKTDLLSQDDLNKMLAYNRNTLAAATGVQETSIDITPLSARRFFENPSDGKNNIGLLRKRIHDMIDRDKNSIMLRAGTQRFNGLLSQAESFLKLRLEALKMPIDQLEEKSAMLRKSIAALKENRADFDIIIRGKVESLQNNVIKQMNKIANDIEKEVGEQLEDKESVYLNLQQKGVLAYQNNIIRNIVAHCEAAKKSLESETKESFRNLLLQYSAQSQSFIGVLAQQLHSLAGINLELIIGQFDLDVYTAFYFRDRPDFSVPDIKKSPFYLLLPDSYVKRRLIGKVRANCKSIIVSNTANIMYDLTYKIQESFRKFSYDLNEKLISLLANIDYIITETAQKRNNTAGELQTVLTDLEKRLDALEQLKNNKTVVLTGLQKV